MNRKKALIHLSDIHFRLNWDEDQGLVLEGFFKDLAKQMQLLVGSDIYMVFSGDVVYAGGEKNLYDIFFKQFDSELNKLGIPKSKRICVPGNHDVSVNHINEFKVEHEGIISQKLNEKDFNDYISREPKILIEKFNNYKIFETQFAEFGTCNNILAGTGWEIGDDIGVYCFNSATLSSGGYNNFDDKGKLSIDTRNLQKWILESKTNVKILVMHHSLEWLTEWAKIELKKILRTKFSLCLSGHIHEQEIFHSINKDCALVECSAPPILTNKQGNLGYAIISLSNVGVHEIQYRQWTKRNSFVTGVNFSDTDDGKVVINKKEDTTSSGFKDTLTKILNDRLNDALRSFSSQPIVWVEPVLSKTNDISRNADDNLNNRVIISEFISKPSSTIIKAPPQFGLTSLAHFLAKEAWHNKSAIWLFIDSNNIKWHSVDKAVKKELEILGVELKNVECIILDSWTNFEKDSIKILKNLSDLYKDKHLIVMQTIDDSKFISEPANENISRNFEVMHLLALPRDHIRRVVSIYNNEKHIGDEDAILSKVVSDLEVLNIHRTPLNCLTLLKVSEKYFDESPVNRTKMLEMVLFLLFNMDGIPTYKSRPDLKDCEYVLGRFCEKMIRSGNYYFSREEFLKELKSFCVEKLIDLEVDVVFDVLFLNNIIIKRGITYSFRFAYWIFYFAAQRMHHDQIFADYILKEKRYTSFPEIIEFYTGIDRRREDALKILLNDLKDTCDTVRERVGLPDEMNPYRLAQWLPTPESIENMQNELSDNVLNSRLPDIVKDQFADRRYNQFKPYDQNIHTVFHEYLLLVLSQTIKASSRALRNSDYVNPELKRKMLTEILRSWDQILKVLLALTPLLAMEGQAAYGGTMFVLEGNFGDKLEDRVTAILDALPYNIVKWYEHDLFSHKLGPLFFDQLSIDQSELKKHLLNIITNF